MNKPSSIKERGSRASGTQAAAVNNPYAGKLCVRPATDVQGNLPGIADVVNYNSFQNMGFQAMMGTQGATPPAPGNRIRLAVVQPPTSSIHVSLNDYVVNIQSDGRALGPSFQCTGVSPGVASPDYGVGYVIASPASGDNSAPLLATYTIRDWFGTARVTLKATNDANQNGQRTTPNSYFGTLLAVSVTDTQGSADAADGLAIVFEIQTGNAVFDYGGSSVYRNGGSPRLATTLSQHGVAICPPIKAGPAPGNIAVRAVPQMYFRWPPSEVASSSYSFDLVVT